MPDFVQVTTSTNTRPNADRIAAELVRHRLAGCVQISGPVTSTYWWKGQVETSEEWLCTAKTRHRLMAPIQQLLQEVHPYELPELIATPIVAGSESYLAWLDEQLQHSD